VHACRDNGDRPFPGGPDLLHPLSGGLDLWIQALGGLSFDDIRARPVTLPALPAYLPQVRNRRALAGHLADSAYAIRLFEVLRANRIVPAAEIREHLGLAQEQAVVLMLFDSDAALERIWDARAFLEIAHAGYDAVVAPSYSAWTPRPRPELLVSARRSLVYYGLLLDAGVNAIPRLVWEIEHDVERAAQWAETNPCVRLAALDLQTYRARSAWEHQLEGLARFDELTKCRITYLVNGPTTVSRFKALFALVDPHRIRVTNATTQAGLRPSRKVSSGFVSASTPGSRFEEQVDWQNALCVMARGPQRPASDPGRRAEADGTAPTDQLPRRDSSGNLVATRVISPLVRPHLAAASLAPVPDSTRGSFIPRTTHMITYEQRERETCQGVVRPGVCILAARSQLSERGSDAAPQ
jgi:hypothetical protein